jgi:hypothetical protein
MKIEVSVSFTSREGFLMNSVKICPSGRIVFGHYFRRVNKGGKIYESPRTPNQAAVVAAIGQHGIQKCLDFYELNPNLHPVNSGDRIFPSIDLTDVSNSNRPAQRGLHGLTSRGRHLIEDSLSVLTRQFATGQMVFCTLTLPTHATLPVAKDWAAVLNRFKVAFGRIQVERGLPRVLVGVVEVQPSRLEKHRELGLHLHFVYVGRSKVRAPWAIGASEIREVWMRACQSATGCPNFPVQAWMSSVDFAPIKKNPGAYMSKYLSKGSCIERVLEIFGPEYVPATWYTVDRGTRHDVAKSTVFLFNRPGISRLYEFVRERQDTLCAYFHHVKLAASEKYPEMVVGAIGHLRGEPERAFLLAQIDGIRRFGGFLAQGKLF